MIDSRVMQIRLTEEKVTQLSREVQWKYSLSARELAQLIGKMTATLPVVYQAPLWYCKLQLLKNEAIQQSQSFDQPVLLNQMHHFTVYKGIQTGVSDRAGTSYKLPKTASSHLGCEGIHQGSERYTHSPANGQPGGCTLCEPHGRNTVPDFESNCGNGN